MGIPTTLVIATQNRGKTAEIRDLLESFPITIKNLQDFGPIPEVEEDGSSFEENAYKKAAHVARMLGLPALADDSGLVVDALNGAPGIYSARYAGAGATDAQRYAKVLDELAGITQRSAFFECALSLAVPTGAALTYDGRCHGRIAEKAAGSNGFGYDPIFYCPRFDKTFGQLTMDEKQQVSHRGRALKELRGEIDKVLIWIEQNMPVFKKFNCHGDQYDSRSCPEK